MKISMTHFAILATATFAVAAPMMGAAQETPQATAPAMAGITRDLIPEQVAVATVLPATALGVQTAAPSETGLRVAAWTSRENNTYAPGELVDLSIRATQDGYLWLLDVGTSGQVHQIYPNAHSNGNQIKAGELVRVPGEGADYNLRASGPEGIELVKVIVTDTPDPIFANTVFTPAGPFKSATVSAQELSKDIEVVLANQRDWSSYNLLLNIREARNAEATPVRTAVDVERNLGLTHAERRAVQLALNSRGFSAGAVDGIFGPNTRRALTKWQGAGGLAPTGYLTTRVMSLLGVW
ncbi:MAG: hypothetical protein CSA72_02660 [Rhodobacterales bacterium]|nr:MAG: hypothetical protein CSA72_02660 [Rhodobacterales bacterium]